MMRLIHLVFVIRTEALVALEMHPCLVFMQPKFTILLREERFAIMIKNLDMNFISFETLV